MNIYQLRAEGDSLNGYRFLMYSKNVFTSLESAEGHVQDFIESCCDPKHVECCDANVIKVKVVELNLIFT